MNGMIVKPDFLKGILLMAAVVVLSGLFSPLYAQEPPPRPVVITVNHSQPMAFGAFTPGASGGSITVPPDGSARTATGTVIPLSLGMYSNIGAVRHNINPYGQRRRHSPSHSAGYISGIAVRYHVAIPAADNGSRGRDPYCGNHRIKSGR